MRALTTMIIAALTFALATAAHAQKFLQYKCDNGAQLAIAFVEKSESAYIQIDGKSMTLPQRISGSGARYAKGGVTLWVKGDDAQLKRPKSPLINCKTGS